VYLSGVVSYVCNVAGVIDKRRRARGADIAVHRDLRAHGVVERARHRRAVELVAIAGTRVGATRISIRAQRQDMESRSVCDALHKRYLRAIQGEDRSLNGACPDVVGK